MTSVHQNDTLVQNGSVYDMNGTACCMHDSCVDLPGGAIHLHSYARTGESDVQDDTPAVVYSGHDVAFGHGAQKIEDSELQGQSSAYHAWK